MNTATDSVLHPPAGHAHPLLDTKRPRVGATLNLHRQHNGWAPLYQLSARAGCQPLNCGGAVAWGVVSLLPIELILQVNSTAGIAMVFSLLAAAIIWNLGTWWMGLRASSSHTLIGSIIGVGLSNQFLAPAGAVTSGVDWAKAREVGTALVVSPLIGFVVAALLLLLLKLIVKNPALFMEPDPSKAPPWRIRGILITTCTGVSFAHGSNDGQKGMGLIRLILVGVVPAAFSLNRTPDPAMLTGFRNNASAVQQGLHLRFPQGAAPIGHSRAIVDEAVRTKQ